ncbi:mycofactocin dehydrogenase MftG [Nocardia brasiliensis]|uniref:Putative dehydrogenase n=1 Tax=Nocardia brasiliensis (strain ATCC 700358 / HUJEG-1) TaxID=1133849 RepID=K0F751_NOCB7|nr:mycofactocin system GMC family oxidoreductase MftG [Nocardia brasiliensis]AFU05567.1 putative dehydrogenase [Nocardia brasiliensis ATCC 700358]OCF86169.1 oxidoreductase [Nocardia brasiliensis]
MTDTLIVGGGTAGCVLAARLSEHPDHTVRLLEAGPVWRAPAEVPARLRDATRLPVEADAPWLWRYPIALAAADSAEQTGNIVRGRAIGGSSAVNGSYFVRAGPADFAAWSQVLNGANTWSFDAVLSAYRRSEHDLDFGDRRWHGRSGPIPVRRTADPIPLSEEFANACVVAGFPLLSDLNAPGATDGVGRVPCNIADGVRTSTALAYLLPALNRPNLTVHGDTSALRIVFRGTRAIGVDVLRAGRTETVWADRIVLSAGAIETAALLLRSGVGDAEQLRASGIPVVHPAPVGAWCTDHPEIGLEYRMPAPARAAVALEYALAVDDLEFRPYTVAFTPGTYRLGVALMRPESAGTVRLRAPDPATPPDIRLGYLRAERDRARLRTAVDLAMDLLHGMSAQPRTDPMPRTPAQADAWLRANLATSQHLSGTCRMGPPDDERAVVDERCRVHGVTGLSIVDLSVVPVPLSRGPQATVVMIAEHAATHLTP